MNDTYFCFLEDEQKAFEIVKLYHKKTKDVKPHDEEAVLNLLDNELQANEINNHLALNHVDKKHVTQEKIHWALEYGHSFRIYLNTLKIICLILEANNVDIGNMTFEHFQRVKNQVNTHHNFLNIHK